MRYRRELDNLRAALGWSLQCGDARLAARLDVALGDFWIVHGHWIEGRQWSRRVLVAREELPPNLCAALLLSDGYIARLQGDFVSANASLNESLLEVRVNDMSARDDIAAWCRLSGHELLAMAEEPPQLLRAYLRKKQD